jgi:putative transposase
VGRRPPPQRLPEARRPVAEPKLAIGGWGLGFWEAVRQVWSVTAEQRCWVYKPANVLGQLLKGVQPKAKECCLRST